MESLAPGVARRPHPARERIAEARIWSMLRFMVLDAAHKVDAAGNKVAKKGDRDDQGVHAERRAPGDRLGYARGGRDIISSLVISTERA